MQIGLIKQVPKIGGARHYSVITAMPTRERLEEELEKDGAENETVMAFIDTDSHTFLPDHGVQVSRLRPAFATLEALANIDPGSQESVGRALELLVTIAFNKGMEYQSRLADNEAANEGLPTLDDYLQDQFDKR